MPVYRYKGWLVPNDFESDGCTMPKFLHRLLRAERWDDNACRLHDFQRRYAIVKPKFADQLLAEQVMNMYPDEFKFKIYGYIVYLVVRIMYPWYKKTLPLPYGWRDYKCQKPQRP